jgi:hypothetical protein
VSLPGTVIEVRQFTWLGAEADVDVACDFAEPLAARTPCWIDVPTQMLAPDAIDAVDRARNGIEAAATLGGVTVVRITLERLEAWFTTRSRVDEVTGLVNPEIPEGVIRQSATGTLGLSVDLREPLRPSFEPYGRHPAVAGEIKFDEALARARGMHPYPIVLSQIRETARWWFFPWRQIGSHGVILERRGGRLMELGTGYGLDVDELLRAYDLGLVEGG